MSVIEHTDEILQRDSSLMLTNFLRFAFKGLNVQEAAKIFPSVSAFEKLPVPFVIDQPLFDSMEQTSLAINKTVPAFIAKWHEASSIGARLRQIIQVPKKIESILLDFASQHALPSTFGTMRPDLVMITLSEFRICEINARFSLNGFLMSSHVNDALRVQSATQGTMATNMCCSAIPQTHSFIRDLVARLTRNESGLETIHVISCKEPNRYDVQLLSQILPSNVNLEFIAPKDLIVDELSQLLVQPSGKVVRSCILELHQDELLSLDEGILRGLLHLSNRQLCLNDLRAVFLAHDKRLLSILCGFQGLDLLESILPGEESASMRQTLQRSIIPTVEVSSLFSPNAAERARSWSAVGGADSRFIFKPALLGKGSGIQTSTQFPSTQHFYEFLESLNSGYLSTGVVQPFYSCHKFPLLAPHSDEWRTTQMNLVGTLLCMDGEFYGPGFFRASTKDLVALSTGGHIFPAALHLPEVHVNARFVIPGRLLNPAHSPSESDLQLLSKIQVEMRRAFALHGALMATSDDQETDYSSHETFRHFVESVFGSIGCHHISGTPSADQPRLATSDIVWDITPMNVDKTEVPVARSHTSLPFEAHTDASWFNPPPVGIAMVVANVDRRGGGRSTLIPVDHVLSKLSKQTKEAIESLNVNFEVPKEFRGSMCENKTLPLFFAENRIRYRHDIMTLEENASKFQREAFNHLESEIDKAVRNPQSQRLLPEKAFILFDNQRNIHSRTVVKDSQRHLIRIRFDLPDARLPMLDLVLSQTSDSDSSHPLSLTTRSFSEIPDTFPVIEPAYWSCSGRSGIKTVSEKTFFSSVMCTNSDDNDLQRAKLAKAIRQTGILSKQVHCLNLYGLNRLYRSGEIIGELLRACSATNLSVGKDASAAEVKSVLDEVGFGVNAIGCFSSELVKFASLAKQGAIDMSRIQLVIFAGEPLPVAQRHLLRSVCSKDGCHILGLFGSAETGVFAYHVDWSPFQGSGLYIPSPAVSSPFDPCLYHYPLDIVHLEILPLEAELDTFATEAYGTDHQVGHLIVTNLIRRPYFPRYRTGDLAEWVRCGDACNGSGMLRVHGRHPTSRSIGLGRTTMYFDLVVLKVLRPLGLDQEVAQIVVTSSGRLTKVTLRIRLSSDGPGDGSIGKKLSEAFALYVTELVQCDEVSGDVEIISETSGLARAEASSKVIKFIDLRSA